MNDCVKNLIEKKINREKNERLCLSLCAHWSPGSFVCLLWRNVCLSPFPIFKLSYLLLSYRNVLASFLSPWQNPYDNSKGRKVSFWRVVSEASVHGLLASSHWAEMRLMIIMVQSMVKQIYDAFTKRHPLYIDGHLYRPFLAYLLTEP